MVMLRIITTYSNSNYVAYSASFSTLLKFSWRFTVWLHVCTLLFKRENFVLLKLWNENTAKINTYFGLELLCYLKTVVKLSLLWFLCFSFTRNANTTFFYSCPSIRRRLLAEPMRQPIQKQFSMRDLSHDTISQQSLLEFPFGSCFFQMFYRGIILIIIVIKDNNGNKRHS